MKDKDLLKNNKKLLPGSGLSWHKFKEPNYEILQTFKNPSFGQDCFVTFKTDELTALCPLTGFPDQYLLTIRYIPRKLCIESKSAKFYFGAYRDFGGFIEKLGTKILYDWVKACGPIMASIDLTMHARGGVEIRFQKEWNE